MTMTLQVRGMSCQHCVHAVTKALQAVPGVDRLAVSIGRADVEGSADPEKLLRAIEDEGYEVKLVDSR
ncbi:MAG TPA: cation transporter [Casimicrobiaceae bacterium]